MGRLRHHGSGFVFNLLSFLNDLFFLVSLRRFHRTRGDRFDLAGCFRLLDGLNLLDRSPFQSLSASSGLARKGLGPGRALSTTCLDSTCRGTLGFGVSTGGGVVAGVGWETDGAGGCGSVFAIVGSDVGGRTTATSHRNTSRSGTNFTWATARTARLTNAAWAMNETPHP